MNTVQRKVSVNHSAVEGLDTELLKIILEGNLESLPPLSTRLVRVFISSTFSDMTHERNALMEHVYHKLKKYCQERYRLEFQVMDLRWGLREDSQDNHTIIEFCIKEIKNCTDRSIGPNFVALLGQKYGYRSFPSSIEEREFETMREALYSNGKDTTILSTWFMKDTNVKPCLYVLQPISSIIRDSTSELGRQEWEKVFRQLHHVLRLGIILCLEKKLLPSKEKEKYFISVTEYEIAKGLEYSKNPNNTMLCFTRNIPNLQQHLNHRKIRRYIDMFPDKSVVDSDAQQMLCNLKHKLQGHLSNSNNSEHFTVKWRDPESRNPNEDQEYLMNFCDAFEAKIRMLVDKEVVSRKNFARNTQVVEVHQHLNTCRVRSKIFRGRETLLAELKSYLSKPSLYPFILHGLSGSGKTSVMAKCASLLKAWFPTRTPALIIRFLGTTSHSCSIRLVLYNLCWHLLSIFREDTSLLPRDYPNLVKLFHGIVQRTEHMKGRVVILLDSIDQLSQAHRAHNLAWLPKSLPHNFYIILSTLPHDYDLLENLKGLYGGNSSLSEIKSLGPKVSLQLVQEWLSIDKRSLTIQQLSVVNEALSKCSLPLYARLVFEEICRWNSFTTVDSKTFPSTIKGIINKLLDNLEKTYGKVFVKYTLSYLTASKNGLSDVELEDVLSLDDDVLNDVFEHWLPPVRRIPPLLIPRLHDALSCYLMEREANGVIVYYWYHRQFIFVAKERYLKDEGHKHYIHSSLAHYFLGTWGGGKLKPCSSTLQILKTLSTSKRSDSDQADRKVPLQPLSYTIKSIFGNKISYNLRKLSEMPFHLIESKRRNDLHSEVLLNYNWLHSKLTAMSLQDVLSDFKSSIEGGDRNNEVNLVFNALRLGGSYLNHNPNTLAFDLLGRLLVFYNNEYMGIRSLLQQCDEESRKHSALLPLRQCFDPPKAMLQYVLEDHSHMIVNLLFTLRELISISTDGLIASWDMSSGECTRTTSITGLSFGHFTKLYVSEDSKYLIVDCDALYSPIHIFDLKTFHLLHSSGRRLPNQIRGFLSGNILCRQKNFIDIRTCQIVKSIDDFITTKKFVVCKVTPDEKFIITGEDNHLKLFDFETTGLMSTFISENPVCTIEITDDSLNAYCGYTDDCLFRMFDINPKSLRFGAVLKTIDYKNIYHRFVEGRPEYCALNEIAISPIDDKIVVLNIKRCNLVLLHVKSEFLPSVMETKNLKNVSKIGLTNVTFSYNALYVLACFESKIMIWNASSKQLINAIRLHSSSDFPWSISKTHNLIASASNIHTAINIWNLQKVHLIEVSNIVNYEGSIDMITPIPKSRLFVVKRTVANNKTYKYMDSFGLDIWNLATGNKETFLKFNNYGKLLKVDVSPDGKYMGLLVSNRDTYIIVYNLKDKKKMFEMDVRNCKTFVTNHQWVYLCAHSSDEMDRECISLYHIKDCRLVLSYNAKNPIFSFDDRYLIFIDEQSKLLVYSLSKLAPIAFVSQDCQHIFPIPVKHHLVLINKNDNESAEVWDIIKNTKLVTLNKISESGILDISGDGRFAVDGRLQVFDLSDGTLKANFSNYGDEEKTFTFVRMTSDGNFVIWIDEYTVKVASIQQRKIMATTCTHEKPSSMALMDHGYIQIFGREDGRLLTTKFLIDLEDFKPMTTDSRTEFLIDIECGSTDNLDESLKYQPVSSKNNEMPSPSESLMMTMQQRAKRQRSANSTSTLPRSCHSRSGSNTIEPRDFRLKTNAVRTEGGTPPRLKNLYMAAQNSDENLEESFDNLSTINTPPSSTPRKAVSASEAQVYTFNHRSKSLQDILSTKKSSSRLTSPSPVRNVFSTLRSKWKRSKPPTYSQMMLYNDQNQGTRL